MFCLLTLLLHSVCTLPRPLYICLNTVNTHKVTRKSTHTADCTVAASGRQFWVIYGRLWMQLQVGEATFEWHSMTIHRYQSTYLSNLLTWRGLTLILNLFVYYSIAICIAHATFSMKSARIVVLKQNVFLIWFFTKKHQQVPAKRNRKTASVNDKNSHESNQSTDPKRLWERAFGCRVWSRRAIKYPRSCEKRKTCLRKRWEILKCMQALISSIYPLQGIHKCALSALYFFLIASRTSDLRSHFKVRKLKSPKKKKNTTQNFFVMGACLLPGLELGKEFE